MLRSGRVTGSACAYRLAFAALVGLLAAILSYAVTYDGGAGDFGWALRAARDLLAGRDPYAYPFDIAHIPYPLPAGILAFPFTPFADRLAGALFFGLSTSLLVYGLRKPWQLLILASPAYVAAATAVQWTPLITALLLFPALAPLGLAKPHIALPVLLTHTGRRALGATVLFAGFSWWVRPDWIASFVAQIGPYGGVIPLMFLPIFLSVPVVLLTAACWRDQGARLTLLMAAVPQRMFYDQLALWLVPNTPGEMVFLTISSWAVMFARGDALTWPLRVVLGIYLPVLVIVLRRRFVVKFTNERSRDG